VTLAVPGRPILIDVAKGESIDEAYERITSEMAEEGLQFIGLVSDLTFGAPSSALRPPRVLSRASGQQRRDLDQRPRGVHQA
jgi:hypothetical protein